MFGGSRFDLILYVSVCLLIRFGLIEMGFDCFCVLLFICRICEAIEVNF